MEGSCSKVEDIEQEKADAKWEAADREYEKRRIVEGRTGSDDEYNKGRNARIRGRMNKSFDKFNKDRQESAEGRTARQLHNPRNPTKK